MKFILKDKLSQIAILLFLFMTGWWLYLLLNGSTDTLGSNNLLFGALYGTTMSIFGVIVGLTSAKHWGGWHSIMGKAVTVLSLGLLGQFIGQVAFSYYNIVLGVEIPYPSLADIGYFGNIPLYTYGIILLAQASGVKLKLSTVSSRIQALLVPGVMIGLSYYMFLREYDFSSFDLLTTVLDFGYPLGLGLNVGLIILTLSLSRKMLGGIMRSRIWLLVCAFMFQYIADFNFLYQTLTGTWYNGGHGDYLYLVAYLFMALGIFQLRSVALQLRSEK